MKNLKSTLAEKKLHLDQKALAKIKSAEEKGIIIGKDLELLLNIRAQYEQRGFLTEAQRALVRKIEKDYEDYPIWYQTRERLVELYNSGALPIESHNFVESVVEQFDERHRWTPLQIEQIINIIERYDKNDLDTDSGGG
jgi:hypothetical protein